VSTFTQASQDLTPNLHSWQTEAYGQDEYRWRKNLTIYAGVRYSLFGQPDDSNSLLTNSYRRFSRVRTLHKSTPQRATSCRHRPNPYLNGIAIGGQNSPWAAP